MANDVGSLFVRLGLDASEYSKGLSKAEYEAQQFSKRQVAIGVAIGTALGDGFEKALRAVIDVVEGTIKLQSQLYDLSIQTGITVEKLDSLRKVGLYSGTSMEEIAGATNRLNRQMAMSGNHASATSRAIKALGLNFNEFKTLSPDEQLMAVARAMGNFNDGAGKGAAAMLLFGRSGAGFLKFLKELNERGLENSQITQESAQRAKDFEDNLVTLKLAADNLKQEIATGLFPWLVAMTNQAIEGKKAFGSWGAAIFSLGTLSPFKTDAQQLQAAKENVSKYQQVLDDLAASAKAKEGKVPGPFDWLAGPDQEAKRKHAMLNLEEAKKLVSYFSALERLNAYKDSPEQLNRELARRGRPKGDLVIPNADNKDSRQSVDAYVKSLQSRIDKENELSEVDKVGKLIVTNALKGLNTETIKYLLLKAQEADMAERRHEQNKAEEQQIKDMHAFEKEQQEALSRRIQAQLQGLDQQRKSNEQLRQETMEIGLNAQERAQLEAIRLEGLITLKQEQITRKLLHDQNDDEVATLRQEIDLLKERQQLILGKANKESDLDFQKTQEELKSQKDAVQQTMAESIANGILDGFRRGSSFADIFLNELKAQFAKTILTPLIQPVVAAGNDVISSILQGIGGIFSGGGVTPDFGPGSGWTNPLGGRAGGGPVSPYSLYRVNERRMEGLRLNGEQFLLTGSQGGVVDSNPAVGGRVNVNQTINVGTGVGRNDLATAMVVAKEQAKAEILRSMRLGGQFSMAGG